jgi:DNA primase
MLGIGMAEIKAGVDIFKVSVELGIESKPSGRNRRIARCPFHTERTPSFHLDGDRQRFHCFGCGASGDLIDLISRIQQCDLSEARKIAAAMAGLDLSGQKWSTADRRRAAVEVAEKDEAAQFALLGRLCLSGEMNRLRRYEMRLDHWALRHIEEPGNDSEWSLIFLFAKVLEVRYVELENDITSLDNADVALSLYRAIKAQCPGIVAALERRAREDDRLAGHVIAALARGWMDVAHAA